MVKALAAICVVFGSLCFARAAGGELAVPASLSLLPKPAHVESVACAAPIALTRGLAFPAQTDSGGREIIERRWRALGITPDSTGGGAALQVTLRRDPSLGDAYHLRVDAAHVSIDARDGEGEFDALTTLAQLAQRSGNRPWALPCVAIADRPALRWRIVSDDVSRGPLPTMRYFEERIRTLASFKINGYSPYMEQVFVDAAHPIVAPGDGITPAELRELATFARRFHVSLIPEQQTFAHMHETLKWETYAPLGELPHGYLLDPADPQTYAFLAPLLREETDATGVTPFFHIGSDEPLDLGRGRSASDVARDGASAVFARHVTATEQLLPASAGRPMIWDDAVQRDPAILAQIPKQTVIVDFHYGDERSYRPYIERVARAGFDQMVSPGAENWNEFYPLIELARTNVGRFVADGRDAHVLGMFMTVWHDDGQSLYDATWYPLVYAAVNAWEAAPLDASAFDRSFGAVFFGSNDPRYADDIAAISDAQRHLAQGDDRDPSDYLFWSDPFDPRILKRMNDADLAAIRLDAERALAHLRVTTSPLNDHAAKVLELAARRYDALARRFQIAREARADYEDARAHADGKHDGIVYRQLNIAKYLCWEMRDTTVALERRYRDAWRYESRPDSLPRVLVRFDADAARSQRRADRLDAVQREDYLRSKRLPPFDDVIMGM